MRKIERQMCEAIKENKDLKIANTQVITYTNSSDVYLHGNLIARIGETWIELFDGGWQSNTTKSRLNAILKEFGMDGEKVFAKNFDWFVQYNGSPIPFFSGMRLAWFMYNDPCTIALQFDAILLDLLNNEHSNIQEGSNSDDGILRVSTTSPEHTSRLEACLWS